MNQSSVILIKSRMEGPKQWHVALRYVNLDLTYGHWGTHRAAARRNAWLVVVPYRLPSGKTQERSARCQKSESAGDSVFVRFLV